MYNRSDIYVIHTYISTSNIVISIKVVISPSTYAYGHCGIPGARYSFYTNIVKVDIRMGLDVDAQKIHSL